MNWSSWKSKLSSIDVTSAIGSIRENTSSAMNFAKNIVASEPQQYIEAEQLGLYYITPNVIAMGYPSQESLFTGTTLANMSSKHSTLDKLTKLVSDSLGNKISKYLSKYHHNRYMIWNLSEKSYDTALFNDSVIEFRFPGYPSPPLQQLFELLSSIDNWLHSKHDNLAIIHCQTGKGRTVTVISAYLAWSKYNNFTPAKALLHCCKIMDGTIKNMTIPSQTRYLAYLTKILINRQIPKQNPLMIQRVIIHKIPIFEINQQTYVIKNNQKSNDKMNGNKESESKEQKQSKSPSLLLESLNPNTQSQFVIGSDDDLELGQNITNTDDTKDSKEETKTEPIIEETKEPKKEEIMSEKDSIEPKEKKTVKRSGVRPYIQIFKNAKLIFSSRRKNHKLRFYDMSEGHIKFEVNKEICGDILVRIRHLCSNGKDKISVCRFAFHCGYLESLGVIRFKKTQLDGAWNSNKFDKDFWIDLLVGESTEIIDHKRNRNAKEFWVNIIRRYQTQTLQVLPDIDTQDRFAIEPTASFVEKNGKSAVSENEEWKQLLTEWNLSQYIEMFAKSEKCDINEWKALTKQDLISIGLSEVDSQIFLNLNDSPLNVANDSNNDLSKIKNKIEIKNENERNVLNAMDDSSKEVMKSMTDLMTMSKEETETIKNDSETVSQMTEEMSEDLMTKNAEECDKETAENGTQSIDTFGDLEQFADGLDLEHVEVDSDTEQNFEMLLEELNDETVNDTENDKDKVLSPNSTDLP